MTCVAPSPPARRGLTAAPPWRGALAGIVLAVAAAAFAPARAEVGTPAPGYEATAAAQAAANAAAGPRSLPPRQLPVPTAGTSPQLQAAIAAPYPHFDVDPRTPEEWKALVDRVARESVAGLPALRDKLGVRVEAGVLGGVRVYFVTPRMTVPEANRRRLLVHLHGGGYVFGPGEAATTEAILMAGYGGYRVISVDYRMPPDAPYPAALDDVMAVWRTLMTMAEPANTGVFGSSTGGALTLAMVLRARAEGLPLPGAIGPGTPWADLAKVGDSYFANEWADNAVVAWDGWLSRAARLYAGGLDLGDPYLSPINGDFAGFPPAILTSGTRDLFLSNTVRTHRKLKRAGVIAELNVYEGMSHAQYEDAGLPESREVFTDIARFFDRHLAR